MSEQSYVPFCHNCKAVADSPEHVLDVSINHQPADVCGPCLVDLVVMYDVDVPWHRLSQPMLRAAALWAIAQPEADETLWKSVAYLHTQARLAQTATQA